MSGEKVWKIQHFLESKAFFFSSCRERGRDRKTDRDITLIALVLLLQRTLGPNPCSLIHKYNILPAGLTLVYQEGCNYSPDTRKCVTFHPRSYFLLKSFICGMFYQYNTTHCKPCQARGFAILHTHLELYRLYLKVTLTSQCSRNYCLPSHSKETEGYKIRQCA